MKRKETSDASSGKTLTRFRPCKKLQVCSNLVDRISQLPDEILIDTLSLLPVKEAGKSCVLSHRWRYLWKMTNRLNFDAPLALSKLLSVSSSKLALERSRYVTWVNEVLKLHECPALEEFCVKFDLDITVCHHDVDNWIKFFIPKRVKVLEINLKSYFSSEVYTISQECCNYFRSLSNLDSMKCLKSISLHFVNINGELLEYFLTECVHLETLAVVFSRDIINLKVTSPSLLHLDIFRCGLSTIELCAPKLVTFKYFGAKTEFRIGANPCLANLFLGGGRHEEMIDALVPFSNHLSKLETLQIRMFLEKAVEMPRIPLLSSLKHLTLHIRVIGGISLLGFADIVAAAPYLNKVTLEFGSSAIYYSRSIRPLAEQPHQSLKVVELLGFLGCRSDFEFAAYLLKNAINLEKLVIDPYQPPESERGKEDKRNAKRALKGVEKLRRRLPPGAELITSPPRAE